jgi:hypothetical protein
MWLKNGVAVYFLVSEWHISELCPSTSVSWDQVRNKYGLEKVCTSDSNIQCYCNWVNIYGVMRWQAGKKGGEIFVQLSLKLQDFCIEWPGGSTCFILLYRFFGNIFPPQHLKNYVRVTRKCIEVARWSTHYLCLDFTIICPKHKVLIFTLKMPKNTY